MPITLNMIRAPDGVPLEMRRIEGGELSIGRGIESDWVLADPERTISKLHCVIKWRPDGWWVEDWSANGTFLRDSRDRMGRGQAAPLQDFDRLRLAGCYEMEIRIEAEQQPGRQDWDAGREIPPRWPMPDGVADRGHAAPPSPHPPVNLFDDPPPRPQPGAGHPPVNLFDTPPPPPAPPPVREAPRQTPPDPRAAVGQAHSAPPPEPPRPAPGGDARAALAAFLMGAGMAPQAAVQHAARQPDPAAILRALGAAFATAALGARRLLAARAGVKHEFRIEQTQMRPAGNNMVKFATDDQNALGVLIAAPAEGADALAEVFHDLQDHQIATLAATQAAARALMEGLSPRVVEASVPAGGMLAGQRKARLWDAYVALHGGVAQRFDDDFDSVFGRAFAEAYERASRKRS